MARRLNLSKSTVHRLVQTLAEEGFLEKNTVTRRYRLGWNLLQLSDIVMNYMSIFREAFPVIESLAKKWGGAVHIGVVESPNPAPLLSYIGKRNPASCTSGGKIILAYQPAKYLDVILKTRFPHCGPRAITCPNLFRRHLKDIRQQGYVISVNELHKGVVSIAAPIQDHTGRVVAAITLAGPTERIPKNRIPAICDDILLHSRNISRFLGSF